MPKTDNKITLHQFVESLKDDIETFEAYWTTNRAENSKRFPGTMGEADWFEQFIVWQGLEKE